MTTMIYRDSEEEAQEGPLLTLTIAPENMRLARNALEAAVDGEISHDSIHDWFTHQIAPIGVDSLDGRAHASLSRYPGGVRAAIDALAFSFALYIRRAGGMHKQAVLAFLMSGKVTEYRSRLADLVAQFPSIQIVTGQSSMGRFSNGETLLRINGVRGFDAMRSPDSGRKQIIRMDDALREINDLNSLESYSRVDAAAVAELRDSLQELTRPVWEQEFPRTLTRDATTGQITARLRNVSLYDQSIRHAGARLRGRTGDATRAALLEIQNQLATTTSMSRADAAAAIQMLMEQTEASVPDRLTQAELERAFDAIEGIRSRRSVNETSYDAEHQIRRETVHRERGEIVEIAHLPNGTTQEFLIRAADPYIVRVEYISSRNDPNFLVEMLAHMSDGRRRFMGSGHYVFPAAPARRNLGMLRGPQTDAAPAQRTRRSLKVRRLE